jgi:uncharacterized protein
MQRLKAAALHLSTFFTLAIATGFVSGCSPHRFFYFPNRTLYADPEAMGYKYETVQYPSLNGKKLWAIFIPTKKAPRGTVVHFHGNYGNISNHFPLSIFLIKHGFDVLIFDYQGYGASEGRPSPENAAQDGIATLRYALDHLRDPQTGVAAFGQSLGGAAAIVAVAQEPRVKGAVIEAAFSSYSQMAKEALRRSAWTWLFSFLVPGFLNRHYNPEDYVARISPRPLFFIHGDKDTIVPVHMSQDLFAKVKDPKKIWIIPGANHLEGKRRAGAAYEEEIVKFFSEVLKNPEQRKRPTSRKAKKKPPKNTAVE